MSGGNRDASGAAFQPLSGTPLAFPEPISWRDDMRRHAISGLIAVSLLAVAQGSLAQAPRTPDDVPPILERAQEGPKSKSDAYRIVGKVLEIDKPGGTVKLSTDEGERIVRPNAQLLAAIRVGDVISVLRPEDPGGASPRTSPRGR